MIAIVDLVVILIIISTVGVAARFTLNGVNAGGIKRRQLNATQSQLDAANAKLRAIERLALVNSQTEPILSDLIIIALQDDGKKSIK